jgi:hypothetical protein
MFSAIRNLLLVAFLGADHGFCQRTGRGTHVGRMANLGLLHRCTVFHWRKRHGAEPKQ